MIGRLLDLSRKEARARADELLERFSLTDAAKRPASTYSGGMRRRLDLAASMIGRPEVLFLDEPTTGLDPRTRNEVWDEVKTMVGAGVTVLLPTLDDVFLSLTGHRASAPQDAVPTDTLEEVAV